MAITKSKLKTLPDAPGVYFFLGLTGKKGKEVLYIGKATSLRDRVRSYFSSDIAQSRGLRIVKMVEQAETVEVIETDSVLEALILEANLIKKHEPLYNVQEKDGKSFNHIVITNEAFPRVLQVRGRELLTTWDPDDIKYSFGPYTQGGSLKEALKIVRKIFPFRDKCTPQEKGIEEKTSGCFNYQLGLCPGVCTGLVSKSEYAKTIRHLKLFFDGKKNTLVKSLEKEMKDLAKKEKFEKAQKIKRTIFALQHIQDIALIKPENLNVGGDSFRIEGYDVAHISGKDMVGALVVVEDGLPKKTDYRKFTIKTVSTPNDTKALKEVLERRLNHDEWPLPKLIIVDGGKAQKNAAERVLLDFGYAIPVVSVVKNEYHRPKGMLGEKKYIKKYENEILLANSEAHRFSISFHRSKRGRIKRGLPR